MSKPLVTIGITAFNAEDSIERAVASALAQDWRPIEIVVVDDCSQDGTVAVLERLSAQYPEVRFFQNQENGGVAASRNRIIEEAGGTFVAFFDDDDESDPARVTRQVARITAVEDAFGPDQLIICHTARKLRYDDGSVQLARTMGEGEGGVPSGPAVAERILLGRPLANADGACPTCSQMARTATYRALGGFDPAFRRSEDTELNVRLAKAGGYFAGIADPLVTQTMTRGSDKGLEAELRYNLMLLDKHRDVADRYGVYDFCRNWLLAKHAWLKGQKALFAWKFLCLAVMHPLSTTRRFSAALPNLGLNRAFGRFHSSD